MKDVGRVGCAETGSRASMEPSCTVSTLTGFDPARVAVWADSRLDVLRQERVEAMAAGDDYATHSATAAMLELYDLKSWLRYQSTGETI